MRESKAGPRSVESEPKPQTHRRHACATIAKTTSRAPSASSTSRPEFPARTHRMFCPKCRIAHLPPSSPLQCSRTLFAPPTLQTAHTGTTTRRILAPISAPFHALLPLPLYFYFLPPLQPAARAMSDDKSYLSFLDSANKPPANASTHNAPSTAQTKSSFDPTVTGSAVPASLRGLDVTYTSDTDAGFEPIVLSFGGSELPSAREFGKCLGAHSAGEVEELSVEEFDPRGEYGDVIKRVGEAGNGKVKVYRVGRGATRCEYYVVSVGDRRLVGARAEAVES